MNESNAARLALLDELVATKSRINSERGGWDENAEWYRAVDELRIKYAESKAARSEPRSIVPAPGEPSTTADLDRALGHLKHWPNCYRLGSHDTRVVETILREVAALRGSK